MFPLPLFLALITLLPLTLALHNPLLTRQSADCLPIFLEYPTDLFIPCGSLYISNLCSCCPGDALGCYTSINVCTTDSYGASLCCPAENPDCGIEAGSAATSSAPAEPTTTDVVESAPATTEQGFTETAGPTTTAQGFTYTTPTTAAPTTTQVPPPITPSSLTSATQSDVNTIVSPTGGQPTSTSTVSSAVATQSSGSTPQVQCGWCGGLAVLLMLNAI
jgi:hypothetical protein